MLFEVPCELDADGVRSCGALIEELAGKPGDLALDLGRVAKMDSSGLGLLVLVQKRKLEKGERLAIQNVSAEPMDILKQFKLLDVLGYTKPPIAEVPMAAKPAAA